MQFGLVAGDRFSDDAGMRTLASTLLAMAISLSSTAAQTRDELVRKDLSDLKDDPVWTYNDLDAGIATTNYQEFLAVAEDLNLHIVELVHGAGAIFSGPGQVLQIREFKQASDEELARMRATLDDWREHDRLPFPDHSADEKQGLKGQLDYPPPGSSS